MTARPTQDETSKLYQQRGKCYNLRNILLIKSMVKKSWLATLILGSIAIMQIELPANAQTSTFYCDTSGSVPVTRIRTGRGDESFIQWRTSFSRGYSAARRCQEVASRFERQHTRGKRLFLTSRRNVNGHPVICYTESENGACDRTNVLFTLRRGTSHRNALRRFSAFQRGASNRPLELSGDATDESTPLELSGGSDEESTPLELAGDSNNTSMPLELSGDSNWSQNDSGELYYNLSAAVSAQGRATNSQNSDPVETTPAPPA
jgi:Circadian oscillating protein COP23